MLQAVMTAPGHIEYKDVPKPQLRPDQVLIRIQSIGVCGSDIHVYHGKHPYTPFPVVQGHEVSGDVVAVGENVTDIAVNDAVTVIPQVVCGECHPCRHGNYHICENLKVMGFQTTGMASELFAVDRDKVFKLPPGISFDLGAMVEPLAVAVHAYTRTDDVKGKKVLVLGAGPIGILVAQAGKALGAEAVMITDLSDYRLDIARQCGVDYTVNVGEVDLEQEITDRFGPDRADLIMECVGVNATINDAIENARKGTDIVIVGVFGDKPTADLGLVQDRELRLIGTLMYKNEDYDRTIAMIAEDQVNLQPMITHHYPFSQYLDAYKYIDAHRDETVKVIISVQDTGG